MHLTISLHDGHVLPVTAKTNHHCINKLGAVLVNIYVWTNIFRMHFKKCVLCHLKYNMLQWFNYWCWSPSIPWFSREIYLCKNLSSYIMVHTYLVVYLVQLVVVNFYFVSCDYFFCHCKYIDPFFFDATFFLCYILLYIPSDIGISIYIS